MKFGMVRAAAVTPSIRVNNPEHNQAVIVAQIKKLAAAGVEIAVFPELCITGYTAADLFFTRALIDGAADAVQKTAAAVPENMLVFFGAPIELDGRLYNCAVGASGGKVLGIVPKTELPEYGEFYEKRYFTPAFDGVAHSARFDAPMGNVIFECLSYAGLKVGCEICEDMWADVPPSVELARAGATVIVNLSASDEAVGKAEYRRLLVSSASGRMKCAYVYADAGQGESVTDTVFSGHNIIAENGTVIAESAPFADGLAVSEIDVEKLISERRRLGIKMPVKQFARVGFSLGGALGGKDGGLVRRIEKYPFLPSEGNVDRAELILKMQSEALRSRFDAIGCNTAVIGVSGGLDSALALMVCVRAVGKDRVTAVTMPCFGTTAKTKSNADMLCSALGVRLVSIDIKNTVSAHLVDISHDKKDVTYENAQARMRTMILFDLANKTGGMVVGTGDLSELALGFATYNGDHMSSYGVNAGVPKTLVKYLVRCEGERLGGDAQKAAEAILGTDISPELLPPDNGNIAQKTEDILGGYEYHDFIIYYYCRYGFGRDKLRFLMTQAFGNENSAAIQKALDQFFKRFNRSQFKRSCLPDGVKIGTVSFSPRSDWRMPSDADCIE